jgi:hypothetical protein
LTSKLAALGLLATLLTAEERPTLALPDLSGKLQSLEQNRRRVVVLNDNLELGMRVFGHWTRTRGGQRYSLVNADIPRTPLTDT